MFVLTTNMRLRTYSSDHQYLQSLAEFSKWILDLGDGMLPSVADQNQDEPLLIIIPNDHLIRCGDEPINEIINTVYPNILDTYREEVYL